MSRWAPILVFVLGLAALAPIQQGLDARRPTLPSSLLYMPDRRLMKIVSFGHGPMLADLVWIQSMNYVMGEFKSGKLHITHLYSLFDVMTELDPNFVDAYVMGAVFLSSVAQEPEKSIALLEKGHGHHDVRGDTLVLDQDRPGRVHPSHPRRWEILNEEAATHLVTLASFATSVEELQEELRMAGRFYNYGAQHYPRADYPARPEWFEDMGAKLSQRKISERHRKLYLESSRAVWYQRAITFTKGSPLQLLSEQRVLEIDSRLKLDVLNSDVAKWSRLDWKKISEPLKFGYFLVEGKFVAPALDAALAEREHTRRAAEFQARVGRWPLSLDELRKSLAGTDDALAPVPPWVILDYQPATGEVKATPIVPGGQGR